MVGGAQQKTEKKHSTTLVTALYTGATSRLHSNHDMHQQPCTNGRNTGFDNMSFWFVFNGRSMAQVTMSAWASKQSCPCHQMSMVRYVCVKRLCHCVTRVTGGLRRERKVSSQSGLCHQKSVSGDLYVCH